MNALTLIQPWASAIIHAGKWIENRKWAPPTTAFGKLLAIHAGARFDDADAWHLRSELGSGYDRASCPASAIIGTARLVGAATNPGGIFACHVRAADVATAERLRNRHPTTDRWFAGPWGWLLEDISPLAHPVPCKGALGLWRLSVEVEAAVRAQLHGLHCEQATA